MYCPLKTSLILIFLVTSTAGKSSEMRPENPLPRTVDIQYLGGYKPSQTLAVIAALLWALSPHFYIFHWWRCGRPKFMMSLIMGMYACCTGYTLRTLYIRFPQSEIIFVAMNEVILLAPCLFYIVTYVLFSRLVSTFDRDVAQRCLPVHPSRITPIFVGTTLLFAVGEAVGVALTAVSGSTVQNIGNKVALISIGFQFFFVELFMLVLFIFRRRMRREFPELWHYNDAPRFTFWGRTPIAWKTVFYILAVTSTVLLVRSVYRIIEFSLGQDGYLVQHEVFLYACDALPVWLAMSIYCFVWPTRALVSRPSQIPLVHHA